MSDERRPEGESLELNGEPRPDLRENLRPMLFGGEMGRRYQGLAASLRDGTHPGERQPDGKPRIENLELNKETLRDLAEPESEAARGGLIQQEMPKPMSPANFCN